MEIFLFGGYGYTVSIQDRKVHTQLPPSCDTPQKGTDILSKLVRTENLLLASLSSEDGDLDLNSSLLFSLTSGKLFAWIRTRARLHDSFLQIPS